MDTPSSPGPPEPWLSALPPVLPHRDPEKELRTRGEGRKQCPPLGLPVLLGVSGQTSGQRTQIVEAMLGDTWLTRSPSALAPGLRQAATGRQHPPQNTCPGCPACWAHM